MRSRLIALAFVVVATLIAPGLLWAADDPPPTDGPVGQTTPATTPAPDPAPVTTSTTPAAAQPPPGAPAPAPQPQPQAQAKHHTSRVRTASKPATARAAGSQSVTIKDFAFGPKTVTLTAGDTVSWTNQDKVAHTATAGDGSFDTGNLSQGQSGSHTFDTAGSFAYICSIHPNMKGTIVVKAASTSGSSTSSGPSGSAGSSSSGSGSSRSSGSGSSGTSGSSGSSASLPQTGLEAGAVAALGALLLLAGFVLRRRLTRAG